MQKRFKAFLFTARFYVYNVFTFYNVFYLKTLGK